MLYRPNLQLENLSWGQTSRKGGASLPPYESLNLASHVGDSFSALRQNWIRFEEKTDWNRKTLATCNQVHGDSIYIAETAGHLPVDADALISLTPGLAVGVFTADCVPILLADPISKAVAAIHCGWKGAAKQLASKTLKQLLGLTNSKPEDIHIWFGASIAQCSYQVGEEVITSFGESLEKTTREKFMLSRTQPDEEGKFKLDIAGAVEDELRLAGILAKNIEHLNLDTFENTDQFYSYRAEGGKTGRMLSFVGFR